MKRTLGHLPRHRARLLRDIAKVIVEVTDDRFAMLVLFGSYARGDYKDYTYEEGQNTFVHQSDFDLLLIVKSAKDAHGDRARTLDSRIEKALRDNLLQTQTKPTVHLIIHDVEDINKKLSKGRYFFVDIKKEGVLLAKEEGYRLVPAKKPVAKERHGMAKADFKNWYGNAKDFISSSQENFKKRRYKLSAFELHQTTECLFAAILLVHTHYKPRTHDLRKLRRLAASQNNEFLAAFPLATKEQRRLFELLRAAYVEARYNAAFKITEDELKYLAKCVRELRRLTNKICKEKIISLGEGLT